jgi:hypothetical protein
MPTVQPFGREAVPVYRCYFLDSAEHIQAVEVIDAPSADETVARSQQLFAQRAGSPGYSFEVWDKGVKLYPKPE